MESKNAKQINRMKKKSIEQLFEKIGSLMEEYYTFIHDDDEITNPQFNVKNSRGITLNLIFGVDESDPRSYASEGHID